MCFGGVFGAVGGAEILGAAPRDVDLLVGRVCLDRGGEPVQLLVGEVLGAGTQDGLDPLQGVALAAAVPGGVLLDAAADLVHDLGSQLDDVEGVQDGGGVSQFLVDRALVAAERVQRRDAHPLAESLPAFGEPIRVGLLRAPRDEVQQPCPHPSLGVTGEVDHPGQFLRALLARIDVVPDVFIDPERPHTLEAGLVRRKALQFGSYGTPKRLPRRPEPAGQAKDGGVFAAQLPDRPLDRAGRDRAPRSHQGRDLLGERALCTTGVKAAPGPLAPGQLDPHFPVGHVVQDPEAPAPARGHDPARGTAHQDPRRGDGHGHQLPAAFDALDMEALQAE